MLVSHDVLTTMIIPGRLAHESLFRLLSGIEKNILMVFYENEFHEKLKYIRHITGRRQEYLFWEIFVWKKKIAAEEGSAKDLESIVELVEQEVAKNQIISEGPKPTGTSSYETPELVEIYRVFHFESKDVLGVPNYP